MKGIPPVLKQVYACMGTVLLFLTNGYVIGLQSVFLPQLRTFESTIKLNLDQESWIAAIPVLILFPAQLTCGALTYKYGRKPIVCFSIIPSIFTCIFMYYAENYLTLFITFMIYGLIGGGISVGTLMIAELCSPKYRGIMLNVKTATLSVGVAFAHLLGNFYNWRYLALLGLIPGCLSLITSLTSPESPPWLAAQGRFEDCKKAFVWLRGKEDEDELYKLIENRKKVMITERLDYQCGDKSKLRRTLDFVLDKAFLKAMSITVACIMFIDISGKQVFYLYAIDVITNIIGDKKYAYYYAVGIDVADIITLGASAIAVKKFNKRSLLFGLGFPAIAVLLIFCLLSLLFSRDIIPNAYRWLSLLPMLIYFAMINIGVVPILIAIFNEICPLSHRELGMAVTGFVFVSLLFTVTKITPFLLKYCDLHGTFLLNAVFITLALVYLYFSVPETNNKTLQDIENELKGDQGNTRIPVEMKESMLPK